MLRDLPAALRRRTSDAEVGACTFLVIALLVILVVGSISPDWLPYSSVLVPAFVASRLLGPRLLPWVAGLALLVAALLIAQAPPESVRQVLGLVVVATVLVLVLLASHRRVRLGVAGSRGEDMLVDLRDRIQAQGRLERVPDGWSVRSVLRAAGGTAFAGDFLVGSVTRTATPRLRVALVDVSGKGIEAGPRSLLLSGAMGGLLDALPAEDFLPAANRFVLGQDWEEGFATAVHLDLDPGTGMLEVRSAGHPPPVLLEAAATGWRLLEAEGPALGLLGEPDHTVCAARLEPGDALVLYTDGVVEVPGRDLADGIDLLAGRARRMLDAGGAISEAALLSGLGNRHDDRALLVVRRETVMSGADGAVWHDGGAR
ncbi:membrane protein [Marmoricola endophyticus]|uniref:Membrane protein n=1 Tax=Marmoricola endophyticus TaxID=2040280 RepID=A0A917BT66_9ACTN|nr:PP2C family protein-serine/threonine phosphatase [Marmoricola endophyticus]GGF57998.1 membrane protein [Marmoricola endophyticus]